jgi:hypothetical protein
VRKHSLILVLLPLALLGACGDDDEKQCTMETVGTTDGCEGGMICAEVEGGEPACFAPVEVWGKVFDVTDSAGIEGATIVGLDANGGARTTVARSKADGTYTLPVLMKRTSDGKWDAETITLRVSAGGYQSFALPPRTALPVDLGAAADQSGVWVVQNSATDVGLVPLSGAGSGLATIEGTVDAALPGGVLVVADQGGKAVATAVSDSAGSFVLFNVPRGSTSVEGYRAGLNVTPVTVDVNADLIKDVVLTTSATGLGTVTGTVQFVNAGSNVTTVLLVVESTFDEQAVHGEAPAGLRADNVTGSFSIKDVPPGKYVVLAAFENDGLVRDPDQTIGGTSLVYVTVPATGGSVALSEGFKITGALKVVSPGASGVEAISEAEPTFVWADDSSEDGYELRVYDALGNKVHENLNVPAVSGSANVSYTWAGASLTAGMIYQFRALSWRDKKGGGRTYISATEDLLGVFEYRPAK